MHVLVKRIMDLEKLKDSNSKSIKYFKVLHSVISVFNKGLYFTLWFEKKLV